MRRVGPTLIFVTVLALAGATAFAQLPSDPDKGRAFALEVCTPCHVVAESQRTPRRLATAPEFRAIANARGTTETSLHAFLSTPHPSMPNLILSQPEQDDVISYILSLRRPQ
jgi:cytochrome c2